MCKSSKAISQLKFCGKMDLGYFWVYNSILCGGIFGFTVVLLDYSNLLVYFVIKSDQGC